MKHLTDFIWKEIEPIAKSILEVAVSRAPYETGLLRSSGKCEVNGKTFATVSADNTGNFTINTTSVKPGPGDIEIMYSFYRPGHSIELSIYLHENLDYSPRRSDVAGGGAKYLESAIKEHSQALVKGVERAIKSWWKHQAPELNIEFVLT
jgi:hypothetical protein